MALMPSMVEIDIPGDIVHPQSMDALQTQRIGDQ